VHGNGSSVLSLVPLQLLCQLLARLARVGQQELGLAVCDLLPRQVGLAFGQPLPNACEFLLRERRRLLKAAAELDVVGDCRFLFAASTSRWDNWA
jgi:hypothetical protein